MGSQPQKISKISERALEMLNEEEVEEGFLDNVDEILGRRLQHTRVQELH
jgi:hypothetical protein